MQRTGIQPKRHGRGAACRLAGEVQKEKVSTKQNMTTEEQPKKWIKRGVQPEVPPRPLSETIRIAKLARDIDECTDPTRKAELESAFKAECATYDQINCDEEKRIVDTYREFMTVSAGGELPEEIDRTTWVEFHRKLIQCKRMAATWLSKSRKFAADRWGVDFVVESETQMELALGIEHHPPTEHRPTAQEMLPAVARTAAKWATLAMRESSVWSRHQAAATLEALRPMADMIERLRAITGRHETAKEVEK